MTKNNISIFSSKPIEKFGTPVVLIGVATNESGERFAEIYVFKNEDVYSTPASLTLHNIYNIAVSPDLISDQSVTNIMLDLAKGHLSSMFLKVLEKYGRNQIPYCVYPKLKRIALKEFRLYILNYGSKDLLDQISQTTKIERIRKLLPKLIETDPN